MDDEVATGGGVSAAGLSEGRGKHLKAVASPAPAADTLTAPPPPLSGAPGERTGTCVAAELVERGARRQLRLVFETDDGQLGTQWIDIPQPLTPTCKFMRTVTLALGTAPRAGAPLDPAAIFVGTRFRLTIGWRKTAEPGGGNYSNRRALEGPKDSKDFLRIHDIIDRIDAVTK